MLTKFLGEFFIYKLYQLATTKIHTYKANKQVKTEKSTHETNLSELQPDMSLPVISARGIIDWLQAKSSL